MNQKIPVLFLFSLFSVYSFLLPSCLIQVEDTYFDFYHLSKILGTSIDELGHLMTTDKKAFDSYIGVCLQLFT